MDILDPEVVWIDGKCFRKLKIKDSEKSESKPRESASARIDPINSIDGDYYSDLPIEMSNNRFYSTHHVPKQIMGFLIGKSFATKKSIEQQSGAQLKLPERNREIGDVAIIGESKESVAKAYRKIESILYDARWKVGDYTHFISIPVNNEDIQNGFQQFKKEVLLNCKTNDGIREDMFVKPGSLHLTITMLTLFNERERESAKELLMKHQSEILEIIGDKPFRIEVKGVEYMNDDPGEINILYGKIRETDSDNSLQLIADKLSDAFAKMNFSRKQGPVKLHVTLMKSRNDDQRSRQTFDARNILAVYADYSFGQMTISEIHISIRYTARDSYYKSSFVLPLNS